LPHSPTPRTRRPLSRSACAAGALWRGGPARPARPCWLAVVTWTPLGHCVDPPGRNSPTVLTRLERGFFRYTPRRAVPYSHFLTGATPSRGTGESCLLHLAVVRGSVDQLHCPFPGCPGVSHGGIRSFFHYRGHCRVLSKNVRRIPRAIAFLKDFFLTRYSPENAAPARCTKCEQRCAHVVHRGGVRMPRRNTPPSALRRHSLQRENWSDPLLRRVARSDGVCSSAIE
jgi:hypothetical protein